LSLERSAQVTAPGEATGLDKDAFAKALESVKETTKLRAGNRWAVVLGRFHTREVRVTRDPIIPHGFGHLGGSPGEIVYGEKSLHFFPSPDAPPEKNPLRFREARRSP
jgi:hypothetical protein